jgi:excisionase family DNA binding protein
MENYPEEGAREPGVISNVIKAPAYYFKEVLDVEEAAEYTGLSVGTLYGLTHRKRIPFYKPLYKKLYFKRSELEAFIFRNKQSADYEIAEQADAILNGKGKKG